MRRVIVIGSGGAGKSTFARQLGSVLGIEVIHLDRLYWRSGWVETPKDEWARTVAELVKRDSWIMDGNYGGTRGIRLAACDTVIMLDIPRRVCMFRIFKRVLMYRNRNRPDMAEGCGERLTIEFVKWVWNYRGRRGEIRREIESFPDKRFVTLRSDREVESFLAEALTL
ncbi:MAG: DNA topology modulation protein [Pyrinomonadaceae bacterium]